MAARSQLTIAVMLVASLPACGGGGDERPLRASDAATAPPVGTPTRPVTRPPAQEVMLPAPYQPLWPFADLAAVRSWQRSFRAGGHSPWHLDAAQTALSFTQGFLGFAGIDRVTSRKVKGDDARIGVGADTEEGGRTGTAAVIHLRRVGTGGDAPWEVVGTDDTLLTLTSPAYGASASSPVTVGGRITGVDESIRITVRRVGGDKPVGTFCCLGTGGQRSPWSAKVSFTATPREVLTIVASTGGHLADVESFAVTGITG
ncbi:MAG: hypothetical protein ABIS86_19430 [Streptosporangiaceae bacterium]